MVQTFPLAPASGAGVGLVEITPKNWHRYPPAVVPASLIPAYVPQNTWAGGKPLTGPNTSNEHGTANVKITTNGPNTDADYMPRTQSDKATALGVAFADPINTPFGSIEPRDGYPVAGSPAPAAPTLTSLSPNTAVVTDPSLVVKAIGTNFTPYSVVEVGGTNYAPTTYVSPTELRFAVDTKNSVAGTITVKVLDHNIKTSAVNFTFT